MIRWLPLLFTLAVLGSGCSSRPEQQPGLDEPVITRQYRSGSFTVTMEVSHTNLTSGEDTRLTLDVQVPERIEVVFPQVAVGGESLSVSESYVEPQRTLRNGKILHRRVWILVPTLPGQATLPGLDIIAGETVILTEPIGIRVSSILPEGLESLVIKDIAASVEVLPGQRMRQLTSLGALAATAILLGAVAGMLRRRRRNLDEAMPPQEIALLALCDLPCPSIEPMAFIHQLDRILRGYLQARFAIPALESTQGELSALLEDADLLAFLARCDDMKFSHVIPPGFTEEAIYFAREYIETTGREMASCD